jgi:hypothetical protein
MEGYKNGIKWYMKQIEYRGLDSWSDALDLQNIIHAGGIYCDLSKGSKVNGEFILIIHRVDYIKVELLLSKHNKADVNCLPPDYYLFAFSNEELIEILQNPGDWGEIDYILSVKLLRDQGIQYPEQTLKAYKDKYWNDKREKEKRDIKNQDEAFKNARRFRRTLPEKLLLSFIEYDTAKMDGKFDFGKYITFILMLILSIIWLIFKDYRNFN